MMLHSVALLAAMLQSPGGDSLRMLARGVPVASLVLEVRARPLAVRDAVSDALRRGELDVAEKIANAYAIGWRDSFLVREVARFVTWSVERRATKLWVDSVRRAGIRTFSRQGPHAAVLVWQPALTRARANRDSAGVAALLGNIGAALLEAGETDTATAYLRGALAMAQTIGDLRVEANAVGTLAGAAEDRGSSPKTARAPEAAPADSSSIGRSPRASTGSNSCRTTP